MNIAIWIPRIIGSVTAQKLCSASVTGTNSGIVLAAGNTVNVGAGASVIGGFIALNLRANVGESNTVDNAGTLNGGTGAGVAARTTEEGTR